MNISAYISAHAMDTPIANKKTRVHGFNVTIEHPKGTKRILHDDNGKQVYSVHMHHSYGYFNNTTGRDGDEVDCFVGPIKNTKEVYIVHMLDKGPVPDQREDEDKCMIGFPSADAAKTAFLLHYPDTFYGGMTALPVDVFKKKMKQASLPNHKRKITAADLSKWSQAVKKAKCPHCGSKKLTLMPTDFETAKCKNCKKNYNIMEAE
jgi:DNA-directed RNA polymerase subunit RPC12/RpoP